MRNRIKLASLAGILAVAGLFALDVAAQRGEKSRARVELVAGVDSVVPGQSIPVGLHFDIDDDWHIYWINSGESGLPPRIKWELPAGFSATKLAFPVPKRHVDQAGITTNILEGEPVLLAHITAPNEIAGDTVELGGDMRLLVCATKCILENPSVSLTLPVQRDGEAKPANAELFERARKALPATESKYLKVRPSVAGGKLEPGAKVALELELEVSRGHHIQSNKPLSESFIATEIFMEPASGLVFGEPAFPEPEHRELPGLGKVAEFSGSIKVRVPVEVEEAPNSPARFDGVVRFQACNDKGRCYAPEGLGFSLEVHQAKADESDDKALADMGEASEGSSEADAGAVAAGQSGGTDGGSGGEVESSAAVEEEAGLTGLPTTFIGWLGFAFLGGLILNVMPCVLPVISIKILSFVQQATEEPKRVFKLGLTFAAGMVMSFWALAAVIMLLKEGGQALGWGFQFQSPRFVIAMMAVMFVFGLSLLGVFHITLPGGAVNKLSAAEEKEGYTGAFMKGVLGTILATPCTAPFLGPALGVAFKSSNNELFMIFTAVGIGMASPFIVLTAQPAWLKFLPRPGAWMEHFKQIMGFLLMGTVVWLMFVLGDQIGADGLIWTAAFLTFLGFGCWILGRQTPLTPAPRRLLAWAVAVGLAVTGWWYSFERKHTVEDMVAAYRESIQCPCPEGQAPVIARDEWSESIPWQPWFRGRPQELASMGYTVYVDYTATWCATCQANKKLTLEREKVRSHMRDLCVIPLKADFTLEDPEILADLQEFGSSAVPLNVIFPAGRPNQPIIMPEQLVGRSALVVDRLDEAGHSYTCPWTDDGGASGVVARTP